MKINKPWSSYTSQFKNWTPDVNFGNPSNDMVNMYLDNMRNQYKSTYQIDEGRSMWDRAVDALSIGVYPIAGAVKGMLDNDAPDGGVTPWEGFTGGIKASNPFGDGYQKGEQTWSDVLHHAGWQPTSGLGKFAKGTVGFLGDVFLDPTTYMTFGVGALLKGTGMVGKTADNFLKMADGVHTMKFDNIVSELTEKGINEDLAKRFAQKKVDETKDAFSSATFMTDDMAEEIVKAQRRERGYTMTPEEVSRDAKKFAKKYNQLMGLRNADEAKGITFGLENLPFGEKFAHKFGALGKTIELTDGAGIRAFSDKVGISKAYQGLRANIYGRKIGKLLSTNAKLYDLANQDPTKLFDFVKFVEFTRGLNADKLQAEKTIRDRAKMLNLTEDQSTEIIRLLEDKTIWHPIKKMVRLAETEEAKAIKAELSEAQVKAQADLDTLLKERKDFETLEFMTQKNISEAIEAFDKFKEEHAEKLANLDLSHIKDKEQLAEARKLIRAEIKRVDEEIKLAEQKYMDNNGIQMDELDELHEGALKERDEHDKYFKIIENLVEKRKIAKENKKNADEIAEKGTENVESLHDATIKALDEEIENLKLNRPGLDKQKALADTLSKAIYGVEGKLSHRLQGKALDDLMDMFKKGKTGKEIREHIEDNAHLYSEHATEVYKYLASKLGYKSWKETYHEPMAKYREKLQRGEDLEWWEEQDLMKLQALHAKRKHMFDQLFNKKTYEEFKEIQRVDANNKLIADLENQIDFDLEKRRKQYIDDDSSVKIEYDKRGKEIGRSAGRGNGSGNYDMIRGVVKTEQDAEMFEDVLEMFQNGEEITKKDWGLIYKGMENLKGIMANQFKDLDYRSLTRDQRNFVINLALKNSDIDPKDITKLQKFALQEAKKRSAIARMDAIRSQVKEGSLVVFTGHGRPRAGDVKSIKTIDGETFYVIDSKGVEYEVPVKEIRSIHRNKKTMTPEQLVMDSNITKDAIEKRKQLNKQLNKNNYQVTKLKKQLDKDKTELYNEYRLTEEHHIKTLKDLEEKSASYLDALRKMDENESVLRKQLSDIENVIVSDDAYESWLKVSAQVDLELLKDPLRHTRGFFYHDADTWKSMGESEYTGGYADSFKGEIHINKDSFDTRDTKRAYQHLRFFKDSLPQHGWDGERVKNALNPNNAPDGEDLDMKKKKAQQHLLEHELSHINHNDNLVTQKYQTNDYNHPEIFKMETRANVEALGMIENFKTDEWVKNAPMVDDLAKYELDPNLSLTDKQRMIVKDLQMLFEDMGRKEVAMGKLDPEQFESMLRRYVPHILTADGRKYMQSIKELREHNPSITHDYGYGTKFNNHMLGRTTEGKSIEEINDYFRDKLQGKNLFSTNIADIYVARALKHTELVYDDKYMNEMMKVFGKEIPADGMIEEGYKAVINMGMLKKSTNEMARALTSMQISQAVSSHLQENIKQIKATAKMSGMDENVLIEKSIQQFLTTNFTPEKKKELYEEMWNYVTKSNGLPKKGEFADVITPMVELNSKQVKSLRDSYTQVMAQYEQHLQQQLYNAGLRGNTSRIQAIQKQMEEIQTFTPYQVVQVNDVIVEKANQARKIQIAKDKNRFLQMYDKFLHFMKLNQTTVVPSFHIRNKLSNMYLNWLGVGKDAVDMKLQKMMWQTVWHLGDREKLAGFRPINIPNPHSSLSGIVNSGQLHLSDAYELAKAYQVIDEGFFAKDLGAHSGTTGVLKGVSAKFDPTDTENFALYKTGAEWGTRIENSDRLLHFVSLLRQGKSIEEAAESSKKFLFDYSDLTAFEQNVMKRLIPYYTWLRKNGRLQVSQLAEQPGKYRDTAKVLNGIEHMNSEEERMNDSFVSDFARDWVQTPFSTTNAEGNKEPIMLSPNLPFMDIGRLPDPTRPLDSLRNLASQLAPIPKAMVELGSNHNMFFNDTLIKENESAPAELAKYALGQFAIPNAVGGVVGADNGGDAFRSAMSSLTGVKTTAYDYETSKRMMAEEVYGAEFKNKLSEKIEKATGAFFSDLGAKIDQSIGKGVLSLVGQPPKSASEYNGVLRPISSESYNKLSESEKKKYTAPSEEQVFALNKRAEELAREEYEKTGVAKRFVWSLFDGSKLDPKKDMTVGYVSKVADGDTFTVKIGDKEEKIRMLLVDTPETVHPTKGVMPMGKEASDHSKQMLFGKDVRLIFEGGKYDQHDRLLAYVELDGEDYNKSLIEQGLGKVRYTEDWNNNKQPYSRTDEYFNAEKVASESGKGIWQYPGYAQHGEDNDFNLDAVARYLQKINQK